MNKWFPYETKLTYKPPLDFSGNDSLTFVFSDGEDSSNVGTVYLTVVLVNSAPVALNGTASAIIDQTITVFMEVVDEDTPVQDIRFTVVNLPEYGEIVTDSRGRGQFTYKGINPGEDNVIWIADDGTTKVFGQTRMTVSRRC